MEPPICTDWIRFEQLVEGSLALLHIFSMCHLPFFNICVSCCLLAACQPIFPT
jgi:hypothetical protein